MTAQPKWVSFLPGRGCRGLCFLLLFFSPFLFLHNSRRQVKEGACFIIGINVVVQYTQKAQVQAASGFGCTPAVLRYLEYINCNR